MDPEDGIAKSVAYVGGTANPQTNNNPNGRLFYLDPDTFEVLDYKHYYIDVGEEFGTPFCDFDLKSA